MPTLTPFKGQKEASKTFIFFIFYKTKKIHRAFINGWFEEKNLERPFWPPQPSNFHLNFYTTVSLIYFMSQLEAH